jgi:DNA repair protein RadC
MQDTKTKLNAQIHAGRRKKLRERFIANGLDNFNECEVLEFALGFCIPRQDTNPAAHSLIEKFGSLQAVIDAEPADLAKAYGIGDRAAVFIHFLKAITSYLAKHRATKVKIVTPEDAIQHLAPIMRSYSVEQFMVVCLDVAGNVIKIHNITNQELEMVHVNVREIISVVTSVKTAQVVLAHNHLNKNPEPSLADMQLTRRLLLTFQNLGIKFVDHLIFADDKNYSFHCSGLLEILKTSMPKN